MKEKPLDLLWFGLAAVAAMILLYAIGGFIIGNTLPKDPTPLLTPSQVAELPAWEPVGMNIYRIRLDDGTVCYETPRGVDCVTSCAGE